MSKQLIIEGEEMYEKEKALKHLRTDGEKWMVYYIDEANGEKWVKEYPESSYHGGGPAQLKLLEKFPWE